MFGKRQVARVTSAIIALLVAIVVALAGGSGGNAGQGTPQEGAAQAGSPTSGTQGTALQDDAPSEGVREDGRYTSKDELAAYVHEFGHLPANFVSKTKAREAGWDSSKGNLDEVCPGMSIGGSRYHNDDGQLPDKRGRSWTECDVNYTGGFRGGERIVFSNDGLVYYTGDHYKSFERLY
ncbi:ribonuclease domain-containing protein [Olsenella sp. DNF00959]|uniref:ribonuclease domain-containing protein n=1 Tax=Olsenella sp. DNF00959 TaxID=1476999 RepID=UPI0007831F21|nr:ribonuclease domain-containing protein [Olsenella sp. DNF00959]KXB63905.1 ribonuclease [Olsenella sp. DNF00959]